MGGCASSRPARESEEASGEPAGSSKVDAAGKAQRPSVHVHADAKDEPAPHTGGSGPGPSCDDSSGGAGASGPRRGKAERAAAAGAALPTSPGQVLARHSGTRSRRLSHVTKDKDIAARLTAEGLDGPEPAPEAPEPAAAAAVTAGLLAPRGAAGGAPPRMRMSVACMSRAGREPGYKKTNQDSCFAFEKYITEDQALFGAMDGHGPNGHLVSAFVKQHLPLLLVDHLGAGAPSAAALSEGFLQVDAALGASRIDCEFSGSTCVGNRLTTSWVGDSRCVLARRAPGASGGGGGGGLRGVALEAVELTSDHKPGNPQERERIMRSQGRVERLVDEEGQPVGPFRVWLAYAWVPGLAMSRALGDQLAHQVGVSSQPEHREVTLTPRDAFMVLASDGVWEFVSSREAVDLVAEHDSPEDGCRALIDEAHQRWVVEEDGVVDDITAVIVRFHHGRTSKGSGGRGGCGGGGGAEGADEGVSGFGDFV
ncbi:MAG: phosphatase 2C-like domain-containing protein [Monoraphidium minutum]|nr:MAG: phosphatase 2C-like domain-containing protein [Monoraphidium minutum]